MVKVHPGAGSMTVTQSRTSWGIELGRHRFSVTRVREARTIGGLDRPRLLARTPVSRGSRRPAWPLAVGVFASVSAFGLFVVGAIASEPSIPRQHARYSLSLPVPARMAAIVKVSSSSPRKAQAAARNAPAWSDLSGPHFDLADEPYVVRAMQAGEFQEWQGADGQRRFLNAGPEQMDGERRCRDLALLVRDPNGSSRTRTARRCAPLPASERTMAVGDAMPAASDMAGASPSDVGTRLADPTYVVVGEADQAVAAGR